MVRAPATGKYRRTLLFVFTLGHSRKSVRLIMFRSSSRIWAELHEPAFRRLGGAPRVVVLDNLPEGVLKADIYDPTLNPLYADVLKHYGVAVLPCRVSASTLPRAHAAAATGRPSTGRRTSRRRPGSLRA
jgi:transposase